MFRVVCEPAGSRCRKARQLVPGTSRHIYIYIYQRTLSLNFFYIYLTVSGHCEVICYIFNLQPNFDPGIIPVSEEIRRNAVQFAI